MSRTYIVEVETTDLVAHFDPWTVESLTVRAPHAEAAQEIAIMEVESRPGRWAHRYVKSVRRAAGCSVAA